MKKVFFKMIFSAAVITMSLISLNNPVWSAQKGSIKLLIGAAEHDNGPYTKVIREWGDELEKKTSGRVSVTYSFGGALGKMGEFYDLTNNGVCDMALALPTLGAPGQFPMAEIIGLPWVLPKSQITSKALMKYVKKGYENKEFSAVKLLTASGGHGELLFTKKKPVTSLEDFKGLKIHGSTPAIQQKIKLMGGIPVAIQLPDLYSALQKGVIDGLIGNWAFMIMFKLDEVTKYATGPGIGGVVFITTIMNKQKWSGLPPDVQAVIDGMSDEYSDKYAQSWDAFSSAGEGAFYKAGGKLLSWNPDDIARMDKLFKPIWTDWINTNAKKGLPAKNAVDDLSRIIKDLGVNQPAIGYRLGD